jgi:hypothetical protein
MEGFYSSHATRETAAAAAVVTRPVRLGLATVNGIWPFATHWAVQVDDTWFEVAGASKVGQHGQCPPLPQPLFPCLLSVALAGAAVPGTGRPRRFGAQPLPRVPKAVASQAAEFLPRVRPFRRRVRRR